MKLLSIAIPCYNSQDYMAHCIESLLPGGEDVEILIVNDGSKDDTAKIADEYAAKYPTIVKVIRFGLAFSMAEAVILLVGMAIAFVVSVLVIRFLMGYIKKHDFKVFGWYRIVLGILVLLYFFVIKQ